nr:F-box protein CPR30-like [Ipomoea batatas]
MEELEDLEVVQNASLERLPAGLRWSVEADGLRWRRRAVDCEFAMEAAGLRWRRRVVLRWSGVGAVERRRVSRRRDGSAPCEVPPAAHEGHSQCVQEEPGIWHLLVHRHDPHTGDSELSFLHSSSPIMPNPHQDSDLFSWEIVGPSKGLFLLYNHQEEAAVWNPGTREFRLIIRGSGFPYSDSLRLFSQAFGFGADPVSNEYKVVRVSDFWDNSTDNWHNPIVSVYSLGTDSWRHFDFEGSSNLRARNMVKSCGTTFLDGCFYWKSVDNRRVFEFDMRKEEFQEIQTPELFKSKQGDLALYGGCVAMFFHDFVDKTKLCVDIWAMDSGKRWGMKVRIGPFVSIRRPLGYGENGEIFLENALSKVAVVEAAGSREAKVFGPMKGLQGGCLSGVFDYKESLVSIKPTTNKHLFSHFLDF